MFSLFSLPITVSGVAVSNGSITLTLVGGPATIISTGGAAPSSYTFNLDVNGNPPAIMQAWGNQELSPAGTNYTFAVWNGANGTGSTVIGPFTSIIGPSAPYSGTLYPSLTVLPLLSVATISGITISGIPSAGQLLKATSPTAASWFSPAGLFSDGTAAAPGISFASELGTGLWRRLTGRLAITLTGSSAVEFDNAVTTGRFGSGWKVGWSSNADPTAANADVAFSRVGAGIVGIGNTVVGDGSLNCSAVKQGTSTGSFSVFDNLGVAHLFISGTSPYTNTFIQGNGGGVVFLGSAAKTSVADTTGNITMSGATSGTTIIQASATASGTLTLPAGTDTLTGKATVDIFTNKTYDTAGTGNVFKIAGTQITANTGTGSNVLATSPTITTPVISGTITSYNSISTAGMGVPVMVASVTLTAQTAAIGTTTLYSVPANGAGVYLLSHCLVMTTAGTGGTVTSLIGWNQGVGAVTNGYNVQTLTVPGTTEFINFSQLTSAASQNITYATTFNSVTGSPVYSYRIRLFYLG